MNQHLVSSIAAAGLATTLTGCCIPFTGGCDESGPATSSSSPSNSNTTVQTTAPPNFGDLPCTEGSKKCAAYLNGMYYGFDADDANSPLGVALRGRTVFKANAEYNYEEWFFCGDQCYQDDSGAFADCNVESSLMNHKVMIALDSNTPLYNPDDSEQKDYYAYRVFAIFYEKEIREKLTRCSYQYDGSTFHRGNAGCGVGLGGKTCDESDSAFGGQCSDEGSPPELMASDDGCEATHNEWCDSDNMKDETYPKICYWKGAAWNSPSNAGAEANMSALSTTNDELPKMMNQRLESQKEGETESGIPLQTYWNELVIDGRVLKKLLDDDPYRAVAAWGYVVDGGDSPEIVAEDQRVLGEAIQFRDHHADVYGVKLPLVSLNVRADVSQHQDVFGPGPEEPEETTTGGPSEGPELMEFV